MPRIARYAIREAEGAPGPVAAVRAQPWSRPRLRGHYQAARPQRRRVRAARGHRLPGTAPAGGGRPARQRLGHRVRAAAPHLPAHTCGRGRARRAVAAVERVQRVRDPGARHPSRGFATAAGPAGGDGVSRHTADTPADPVEDYLDRLFVTLSAALVGGAGFLAIGAAGLVARLLLAVKGDEFLTAPWPAGTYTRADCARWLAGDPGTHSCVTAMLADHAGDFLLQATSAGLLGLIALAAYLTLRQRWQDRATLTALPAGTAEALGTALAAVAAVVCLG